MRKFGQERLWSEERIEQVHKLILAGNSANMIAAEMKVSRNAIVGVIDRHLRKKGVRLLGGTLQKENALKAARERRAENAEARREAALPVSKPPLTKIPSIIPSQRVLAQKMEGIKQPPNAPDIDVAPPLQMLPLMLLTSSACRFPVEVDQGAVGGYLFCAQVRDGESSYCRKHRDLCRTAPQRSAVKKLQAWPS